VLIQADAGHRMSPEDITRLQVRNTSGRMVPLSTFVSLHNSTGPSIASDYNTYPAIDILGAAGPGFSDDQARAEMQRMFAALPRGYWAEWTELTYQQLLAGDTGKYIFPICVLLVVLVLAAFYESLVLPLAIVLIVPMCLMCALIGVNLVHSTDNIMTQIGLIVLVGLACKNAILIVEFAKDAEIHQGMPPLQAALEACRLRLRPILMTSFAFIMGVYPLVVAFGAGAELRRETGIAVFAGMIGVTIFGLLLTPVFYVVLRRMTGSKPLKSHERDDEPSVEHPTLPPH
jgi:multidrug efflux pump subunit AcrB